MASNFLWDFFTGFQEAYKGSLRESREEQR
jgi:hypothetical protein